MKISTRIVLGLGLLLAVVVGAGMYQLSLVRTLQRVSDELAEIRLQASRSAIAVLQAAEDVREFAAKAVVLGDVDYHAEWIRSEERLASEIDRLMELPLDGAEHDARTRILDAWTHWFEIMDPLHVDIEDAARAPAIAMAADFEELARGEETLLVLRAAAEALLAANDERVTARAEAGAMASRRAHVAALGAAGVTAFGTVLLGWFLWAAISGPLRRLTKGTQELARGRFDHRIPDRSRSEFGALARDFNRMAEQLAELEELKRDFVSHVSHELKGPLAAVQETNLVLLEDLAGPLTPKQRHLLTLSHDSAARLSRMISDLLELSRLEANAALYDPAAADLSSIAREVLREATPLADDRGLVLSIDDRGPLDAGAGGTLIGDGDRLREVVSNLVGNAIKFSPEGGTIRVAIDRLDSAPSGIPGRYRELAGREEPPYLLLTVEDEGPGIPFEHRDGVFEKFYQVKIDGRKHGQGVGLGLAISRRIVEAHGGAIWVTDRAPGGTTFHALLPVHPRRWSELGDSPVRAVGMHSSADRTGDDDADPDTVEGVPPDLSHAERSTGVHA